MQTTIDVYTAQFENQNNQSILMTNNYCLSKPNSTQEICKLSSSALPVKISQFCMWRSDPPGRFPLQLVYTCYSFTCNIWIRSVSKLKPKKQGHLNSVRVGQWDFSNFGFYVVTKLILLPIVMKKTLKKHSLVYQWVPYKSWTTYGEDRVIST